jgi:hypothetical protein
MGGLVLRGFGLCGSCVCPVRVSRSRLPPVSFYRYMYRDRFFSCVRECPGSPRCLFTGTGSFYRRRARWREELDGRSRTLPDTGDLWNSCSLFPCDALKCVFALRREELVTQSSY